MKIRDMRECTEQHKRNFVEFAIYSHMNEVDEVIKQAKKVTKRAVIEVDHTEVDGLGWGTLNASNFYVLS
jgi:glycerol-3-phosphate responsive antiterminator